MAERLIQEETLIKIADAVRNKLGWKEQIAKLISSKAELETKTLPEGVKKIGYCAFKGCTNLALTSLPESVTYIDWYAFEGCEKLAITTLPKGLTEIGYGAFYNCNISTLTFKGVPRNIFSTAFENCPNLTTINVPWSEGEVAGAPWGATNATINYNYVEEGGAE